MIVYRAPSSYLPRQQEELRLNLIKHLSKKDFRMNSSLILPTSSATSMSQQRKELATLLQRRAQDLKLSKINRAAGPALADLGSKFQNFATRVIKGLNPLVEYLADLFNCRI